MVVYIAGPFRATNPDGTNDSWRTQQYIMRAMTAALDVWQIPGASALCPHANTMFFQHAANVPDRVWLAGDLEQMRRCDAVFVVEGWRASSGASAEVAEAERCGIPVFEDVRALAAFVRAR
jgi:hypothetical protein